MLFAILVERSLRTAHRNDVAKTVSALDTHVVGNGPQSMRRIQVTISFRVLVAPPQALPGIGKEDGAKIVQVRSLSIQQIAEETCVGHPKNERLVIAVATILKDHAVPARLFRGADNLPAVFDRGYTGHLNGYVLAMLHREDRLFGMPVPRRCNDNQIDVAAPQHGFEVVGSFRVELRLLLAGRD